MIKQKKTGCQTPEFRKPTPPPPPMPKVTTTYNIQISDGIMVKGNQVYIDGKPLPPAPCKGHNSTMINGKVFLDGYEFKRGKWRRTLKALWHLWF